VSNRYFITTLASAARRTGDRLHDLFLQFQAVHSLTTNALSIGALADALHHAKQLCRWLDRIEREQPEYAAYTARNIAPIMQEGRNDAQADHLISTSRRLAEHDPELLVRHAEVLCMRGDFAGAEPLLEQRLAMRRRKEAPIREVIAMRIYGLSQCLAGSSDRGRDLLEKARRIASQNGLGHQENKIGLSLLRLDSEEYERYIRDLHTGKARQGLPQPLLDLF